MQIFGCVEEPRARIVPPERLTPDGRFLVTGWAFASDGRPVRVRALHGDRVVAEAPAIGFRDDVAEGHRGHLGAGRSGFGFLVEAPPDGGPFILRVEVSSSQGDQVLEELTLDVSGAGPGRAPAWRSPDLPARMHASDRAPRLLFATHNLNLEGAPIILQEIASRLVGHPRSRATRMEVVSPVDGPLHERWIDAGGRVRIEPLVIHQPTVDDHLTQVRRLAAFQAADPPAVVIANTLDAFWGVDLARELDRKALWIVHESVAPDVYFHERFAPDVAARAIRALEHARVVFVSDATARMFEDHLPSPPAIIPNGHAAEPIDDREACRQRARKRLGLPPSRPILLCVGTTCQRKGQRLLVEAMLRLGDCEPYPSLLLVGGREGPYRRMLDETIDRHGLHGDIAVIDETRDTRVYYEAADIAVCPSFQESLPRVVQEAMALALPVVASDVHGIPELVRHEREGLLFETGSVEALASAIRRLLHEPTEAARMGHAGHDRLALGFGVEAWIDAYVDELVKLAPDLVVDATERS